MLPTFKEFLVEASSGKEKWEKYFSSGEVETIAKNDASVTDVFGKKTKSVKRGDKLTVLASDDYKTTLQVRIGDGTYLMKLADIDKPFKVNQTLKFNLKPDQLGIVGKKKFASYAKAVKDAVDAHDEIPENVGEYLKALVDAAKTPGDNSTVTSLFVDNGIKGDTALINTINTDFMELLGPFLVANEKPEYKGAEIEFPELGNEPLYDFKLTRKGSDIADQFSSKKAGGGSTNTLKVTEIIKAADAKLRKKYAKELVVLSIIADNSVKAAPDLLNDYLAKTFSAYKKAAPTTDATSIARLESATVRFINEHSGLNFDELVMNAVPDIWYVKSKLKTDGSIKVEPIKSGRDVQNMKLRSKSSPGHLADKIGFAM